MSGRWTILKGSILGGQEEDWENCSFGSVTITGLNEVRSGYWDNGLQLEISQNEGPV